MVATMEAAMFIMFNMHACVCVCMRACAHMHVGCLHPTPPPLTHPPTPQGGTPQISKITIRIERIEVFRFHLKIWNLWRLPHPWVDVFWWLGGWVGGLVGRNLIKLDLSEIIWFCLKIYDLWTHSHLWIGVWVGGWVGQWVGLCQIIKNWVNHNLIKIIEFCLKIYDLWRHPYLWVAAPTLPPTHPLTHQVAYPPNQ